MALRMDGDRLHMEGECGVEEALELLGHMAGLTPPEVDLRRCTHMHTALVQVLAACGTVPCVPPEDAFLARWLMPMFGARPGGP